MKEEQIILVKKSWKMLRGIDPAIVGDTFYSKLFSDNPALRKLFPTHMQAQYQKLMEMIGIIVARIDRMEELSADLEQMSQRHAQYGVRPEHYKLVGKALLWTLQRALGKDWTITVKEAWEECYNTIADIMIRAAVKPLPGR